MAKANRKNGKFSNLTRNDMGEAHGVDVRTISRWVDSEMPRLPNGRYDLPETIRWRVDRESMIPIPIEGTSPNLERYRAARAGIAEMELEKARGQLVSYEVMMQAWCKRVRNITNGLELFTDRLAPMLEGRNRNEIRAIISAEVENLRHQYARHGRYTPSEKCEGGE